MILPIILGVGVVVANLKAAQLNHEQAKDENLKPFFRKTSRVVSVANLACAALGAVGVVAIATGKLK